MPKVPQTASSLSRSVSRHYIEYNFIVVCHFTKQKGIKLNAESHLNFVFYKTDKFKVVNTIKKFFKVIFMQVDTI